MSLIFKNVLRFTFIMAVAGLVGPSSAFSMQTSEGDQKDSRLEALARLTNAANPEKDRIDVANFFLKNDTVLHDPKHKIVARGAVIEILQQGPCLEGVQDNISLADLTLYHCNSKTQRSMILQYLQTMTGPHQSISSLEAETNEEISLLKQGTEAQKIVALNFVYQRLTGNLPSLEETPKPRENAVECLKLTKEIWGHLTEEQKADLSKYLVADLSGKSTPPLSLTQRLEIAGMVQSYEVIATPKSSPILDIFINTGANFWGNPLVPHGE